MKKLLILITLTLLFFTGCKLNEPLSTVPPVTPTLLNRVLTVERSDDNPDVFSFYSDTYTTGVYADGLNYSFIPGPWTENEHGSHPEAAVIEEISSPTAPEGSKYFSSRFGANLWFGWGWYTEPAMNINAAGFSNANLCFSVKHTGPTTLAALFIEDADGGRQDVVFVNNGAPADDAWHAISVPVTIDVTQITGINIFNNSSTSDDFEICVDNIRLEK